MLYQDGLVIFHRREGDEVHAYQAQLNATQTKALVDEIASPTFLASTDDTSAVRRNTRDGSASS